MKHKKNYLITAGFLLLFSMPAIRAQDVKIASGGNALGAGGSVSYSVGQIVYKTDFAGTGSVAQGVQQPFEISTVLSVEQAVGISLAMTAFPNPTTDFVTLKVENYDLANLGYRLVAANGRYIENKKILASETTIAMLNFPSAIYFLQVLDQNKQIKTFKIIKN